MEDSIVTDAAAVAERPAADTSPRGAGWLHLLVRWLDRLPGSIWLAYLLIGVAELLTFQLIFWTSGRSSVGTFDRVNVFWGLLTPAILWIARYLERVASRAVADARPALRMSDAEVASVERELTSAPTRGSAIVAIGAIAFTAARYVGNPVEAGVHGVAAPLAAAAFAWEIVNVAILAVILYQLLRQMRVVRRTLEQSAVVDLFLPGPLSAFARLTARAAMAIVLIASASLLFVPVPGDPGQFIYSAGPYVVLPTLLALIAFVVPLYGFHERLAAEKERLQGQAEARLKGLLAEINHDVDGRELERADALNKTLSSVLAQREVLAKLPTWPWSAGTFRGFVTAILLPLAIFVTQQVLVRFL